MKSLAFITGLAALAGTAFGQAMPGSGLVVLHQTASGALSLTGQSSVRVPAHSVYVNSSSQSAVTTVGAAIIDTPNLYLVGGANFTGGSGCTGTVVSGGAPYQNPCSGFMFPNLFEMEDRGGRSISGGSNVELEPGYYSGGITVSGNSNVLFKPGNYVIAGAGLKVTSGALSGNGVHITMMAGGFDIAGASTFVFTPPLTGYQAGMVFAQPNFNTTMMKFSGNSGTTIYGTIYAPKATVRLVGTSSVEGEGPQMGDLVVADKIELTGTSLIKIGRENLQAIVLPKLPLFD